MPLTRLNVETILSQRRGILLTQTGIDPTPTGSNPVYDDPLRDGLDAVSIVPAAYAVSDADLAGVADSDLSQVLDVAEYRVLKTIQGNLFAVDQTVSQGQQRLGQLGDRLLKESAAFLAYLIEKYSYGVKPATVGKMDLGFAEINPYLDIPMPPWFGEDY